MVEAWDKSPPVTCADAMHVHAMLVDSQAVPGCQGDIIYAIPPNYRLFYVR
jgi:hypothetical protein